MDNNLNNGSGIPNVSDIKFDDTPAESFDNLYGGASQESGMVQYPGMNQSVNQGPAMIPNPSMGPSMNQGPAMAPNPSMGPSINQGPAMAPNQSMGPSINQGPAMAPNPGTIIQTDNMEIGAEKMQSIEEQLSKTTQYNPSDFQQEQMTIPTDNQYEKNKSGIAFLIVLSIILALVIAFAPQFTKLIK